MGEQNLELINKKIKDAAETLCEDWARSDRFSGVCMVKCKGHTVFSGAYGFANRAFKIPNKIDTKFDTASITKLFTAAAILQLIQEKKLKLSDRITQMIDLEGTEISPDVTIEQLLNHTSDAHAKLFLTAHCPYTRESNRTISQTMETVKCLSFWPHPLAWAESEDKSNYQLICP